MKHLLIVSALGLLAVAGSLAADAKVEKLTFTAAGAKRTYYLFVPEKPGPMPVLLLLHGSGRNGKSLIDLFEVKLTEIPNHTHDYYSSAADINRQAWAFLQQYKLSSDPKFQEYDVSK